MQIEMITLAKGAGVDLWPGKKYIVGQSLSKQQAQDLIAGGYAKVVGDPDPVDRVNKLVEAEKKKEVEKVKKEEVKKEKTETMTKEPSEDMAKDKGKSGKKNKKGG